jgi:pimeloyl-ACP methyl ester carboxylesterase
MTRIITGLGCWLLFLMTPLGKLLGSEPYRRHSRERFERGLIVVLPGIEGRSFLNLAVVWGLDRGGVASAIETFDWTWWLFPIHPLNLRAKKRNRAMAAKLAQRICDYQDQYPGRPVTLVGHSGGGAITAWVLEALPAGRTITGCIQLAPAISPGYQLGPLLERLTRELVVFHSWGDWFFVGVGTWVVGTLDGVHTPSAGMRGYKGQVLEQRLDEKLRQMPYRWSWLKQFHLGEHFGCVHVLFVAETVAPIVCEWERVIVRGDESVQGSG